jgi:TonB family protein
MYTRGEKSRRGEIVIISSKRVSSPFSFFNIVFIRDEDDQLENECVITHEKAHVRRGHSLDIILISIINTIQWFNPFIYLIKKSLVSVHEYQADKDVIMSGYAIKYYQNLVLYSQFGVSPLITNKLNNSLTIKRLRKMENLNEKRNRAILFVSVILMVTTLFFVISCKTNRGNVDVVSADTLKTAIQKADTVIQPVAKPVADKTVNTLVVTGMKPVKKTSAKTAEKAYDVIDIVDDATPPKLKEKLEDEEIPFTVVEVKPTFMGGDENTFTKWVFDRLQYPEAAKNDGIQGRVILQFLVTETGKVTSVKVVRGVDLSLDQEAIRVVATSPDWTPGKHKGKNVAVRYTFPVIFQLR